jgi:DNA-binding YbaB/EbfC family protein
LGHHVSGLSVYWLFLSMEIRLEFEAQESYLCGKTIFMFDLMNKLGDLKNKMEEAKSRLDQVSVTGSSGDNEVVVRMSGNRKVLGIDIADHLLFPEKKEEVQELLEVAMNRAIQEAERVNEAEMKAAGRDLLPGMPF